MGKYDHLMTYKVKDAKPGQVFEGHEGHSYVRVEDAVADVLKQSLFGDMVKDNIVVCLHIGTGNMVAFDQNAQAKGEGFGVPIGTLMYGDFFVTEEGHLAIVTFLNDDGAYVAYDNLDMMQEGQNTVSDMLVHPVTVTVTKKDLE